MRTLIALVAAASLITGFVGEVSAEVHAKKHKHNATRAHYLRQNIDREPRYSQTGDWYPRDANKLPFGSSIWWEQMRREGRLGGETP